MISTWKYGRKHLESFRKAFISEARKKLKAAKYRAEAEESDAQ